MKCSSVIWRKAALTRAYFDKKKQGISGHYFVPRERAYVELRGQNKYASLLDTCQIASIFFYNKGRWSESRCGS